MSAKYRNYLQVSLIDLYRSSINDGDTPPFDTQYSGRFQAVRSTQRASTQYATIPLNRTQRSETIIFYSFSVITAGHRTMCEKSKELSKISIHIGRCPSVTLYILRENNNNKSKVYLSCFPLVQLMRRRKKTPSNCKRH